MGALVTSIVLLCVISRASRPGLPTALEVPDPVHHGRMTLLRRGDFFASESVKVPASAIDQLFSEVTSTHLDVARFLAAKQVTDATLLQHTGDILAPFCGEGPPQASLPDAVKSRFLLRAMAIYLANPPPLSATDLSTISGTYTFKTPGKDDLVLTTRMILGCELIQAECGKTEWLTDATGSLKTLRRVNRTVTPTWPQTPEPKSLVFWDDEEFWRTYVGQLLDREYWPGVYQHLDGYLEADQVFHRDAVGVGNINEYPLSLFMQLSTRSPSLVDSIWWFNPLPRERLTTWSQLLRLHRHCTEQLQRHAWLVRWKAESSAHHIELEVYGQAGFWPGDGDLGDYRIDNAAWQAARLHGHPMYKMRFRNGEEADGDWTFSDDDPRVLMLSSPTGLAVKVSEYDNQFAVVEPNGQYRVQSYRFFKQ